MVTQRGVYPLDERANPPGLKVLAIERHGFLEDFVSFRTLYSVQSFPPIFASNHAFECGSLPGQAPGETLCNGRALSEMGLKRKRWCCAGGWLSRLDMNTCRQTSINSIQLLMYLGNPNPGYQRNETPNIEWFPAN